MNIEILIGIIVVCAIAFFLRNTFNKEITPSKLPYKKRDFLLNIPERKFFEQVQKILPDTYVIFPQIVLSTIVAVDSDRKSFWKRQNKINKKTIDFVIFEKQYLKPVWAIEYDGSTHKRTDRKERDLFVNEVLASADIKILHYKHTWDTFTHVEEFIAQLHS